MARTKTIRDLMTKNPKTLSADTSVSNAARAMRDQNIGNVLVEEGGKLCGIVTDRDIVVRGIADDKDPTRMTLRELCSDSLTIVAPDNSIEEVIKTMRSHAIRRVPVVENDKPVGIVSLGDLAIERDRRSVLGEISAASATR